MSKGRPITYYYPSRKKSTSKPSQNKLSNDTNDYARFLECNKLKFDFPKNLGFAPLTPPRSSSLKTWVYPGSKGFRKYQFTICQTCLFYNTLVCIPTGLGKTFIAATVMYNYYRWFKDGLVFFLAPTKPLVDQQYTAFMDIIIGFNKSDIGQLTGKQSKKERRKIYTKSRILFMTPQTLANDIKSEIVEKEKIVCIVFDEAHRGSGNYAYCIIVKELLAARIGYRIVGLSATPGPNVDSIQQIITNLCIAKVEARSEDDVDVKPYTHSKDIELIRVKKTSEIAKLEELFVKTIIIPQMQLQKMHFLPFTKDNKVHNKMTILDAQERFKRSNFERNHTKNEINLIYSNFASLLSLLCGLNMLLTHGLESARTFCEKFRDSVEEKKGRKPLVNSKEFKDLMNYFDDINKSEKNHPKLVKMRDLLVEFFHDEAHKKSQVIIFTLFVNSAQEICKYLEPESVINSKIFIGQANGYTQKDQMRIINEFKAHKFNTLVATCIGEEGLDIGYVDLIISYDCTGSPVRMIQRFGRTGRKQEGKIVILLCDDEERKYNKMQKMNKTILAILKKSTKVQRSVFSFFDMNPRMIDENINPVCIYATKKEDFGNPKAFDHSPNEKENEVIIDKNDNKNQISTQKESDIKEPEINNKIKKENEDSKLNDIIEKYSFSGHRATEDRVTLDTEAIDSLDLDRLFEETKENLDIGKLSESSVNTILKDILKGNEEKTMDNIISDKEFSDEVLELAADMISDDTSERKENKNPIVQKRFKYDS